MWICHSASCLGTSGTSLFPWGFIAEEVDGIGEKGSEFDTLVGVCLNTFLRSACFMKLSSGKKQNFWSGNYYCQVPGYQGFWIIVCQIKRVLLFMFVEKDSLPWHVTRLLVVVHVCTVDIIGTVLDISEKFYELWNLTHLIFSGMSKLSRMKNIRR